MGGGDELDAAFGDGAGGERLELGADLVDHDHFRHVILDGLDHHGVLALGGFDLHASRPADAVVRDVAIAGDLVGGIDDHDALALLGEHAGDLAEQRGLADTRATEQQDAGAGADEVFDQRDRAGHGAADAHG